MTTNKPGSETQQPLYGCTNCYDIVTYPADHLRIYNGECWCGDCWEYATHEIADGLDWGDLEPFKPALQAECEKLRKDAERCQSLLEAVLCEIPHREARRGNAPGHAHSVPGIWDEDNGALAGKECAWCKVWNEAVSAAGCNQMTRPADLLEQAAQKWEGES